MEDIRAGGRQREKAWHFITMDWGTYVLGTTLLRTRCNEQQAKEAFSIAVVGVDARVSGSAGNDFLKTATLKTYLTQSTIHAALRILGIIPHSQTVELDIAERLAAEDDELRRNSQDCVRLLNQALQNMTNRCNLILGRFYSGFSMEEIAVEMGFKSADVARREKYECLVRFKTWLNANPSVKKQLQENCYG